MEKMDGMTMNIEQANVEKLKEVFPEVFADGKVDFDKLQRKYFFGFCKAPKIVDALIDAGLAVKEKNESGAGFTLQDRDLTAEGEEGPAIAKRGGLPRFNRSRPTLASTLLQ